MLLANAGAALVRIGRWDEAERFLQMSADVVSPYTLGSTYHLLQRSLLRLWQGEVALARADLAGILQTFPDLDPQLACPVYTQLAEAALWHGRPGEAREAVTTGLRAVEGTTIPRTSFHCAGPAWRRWPRKCGGPVYTATTAVSANRAGRPTS
jgi:hypothetical protein